jgi:hypothetical protein
LAASTLPEHVSVEAYPAEVVTLMIVTVELELVLVTVTVRAALVVPAS